MNQSINLDVNSDVQRNNNNSKIYPHMENNRILSRSIVLDVVSQKIDQKRYLNHKASLQKISHCQYKHHSVDHRQTKHQTRHQGQLVKTNNSSIKQIFNNKSKQNQALIKKMIDIDRRKNQYQTISPIFPFISKPHRYQQQEVRKQNQIMVQKIVHQRSPRSRQQIIAQSRIYEKYKANLRKFKKKHAVSNFISECR